jgi:hypothetical protein
MLDFAAYLNVVFVMLAFIRFQIEKIIRFNQLLMGGEAHVTMA